MSRQSIAIEQLILAFEKGERNNSHIEWEDLELAYQNRLSREYAGKEY